MSMYSLFINSVLIESSNDFDVLVRKRYSSILEFLKDGYKFVNDSDAKEYNNNSVIELSKDDDIKKLSILWSGNTVENTTEENINENTINDTVENSNTEQETNNDIDTDLNNNENKNIENIKDTKNIEDNADTIEDQNKNMGLNLDDDLDSNDNDSDLNNDNNSSEENDSIIINDSSNLSNTADLNNKESILNQQANAKSNINSIKNNIINTIVSALQTLEYDSAFIPSKTFARQIQNLFNNPEYITYKQQFITSILAGKSEHEIIIPIKQNDNLVNIYTLCYILITRGYQFNLSVDDEYNLHIQITW